MSEPKNRGFVDANLGRRARRAAQTIIAALSTGKYCGASSQRCEVVGLDCCMNDHEDKSWFETTPDTTGAKSDE